MNKMTKDDFLPDGWETMWEMLEGDKPIKHEMPIILVHQRKSAREITSSHLHYVGLKDKGVASERTWALFELCYEYIGGFKSYANAAEMARDADYIFAIYDGKLSNSHDFNVDKCYCIMCFENKHGLKVTGGAINPFLNKQKTMSAWKKMNRYAMKIGWCEVSGKAEKYIIQTGAKAIDPHVIKCRIYPDKNVEISSDGRHYTRDTNFGKITKSAYGNIRL